jgi:hypothetical protein
MDFILEYGDQALDALDKLNPEDAEMIEQMIQDGLLDKIAGRYRLTPRAINQTQHKALMEIVSPVPPGSS